MIKLYEYIFYAMYSWTMNKWGEKESPRFKGVLAVVLVITLNSFNIACLINLLASYTRIFSFNFFTEPTPIIELLIFYFGLIFIVYNWLIRNNRYVAIVNKYEKQTRKERIARAILVWAFILFSFILFAILSLLIGVSERGEL